MNNNAELLNTLKSEKAKDCLGTSLSQLGKYKK